MRCWCGYLSGSKCRLFAYGPADVTAIPKPNHLLPYLNPDWFPYWYRLTQVVPEKKLCLVLAVAVVVVINNADDITAVSSSAARCLARETQMRQLVGSSDADVRPTLQEVSTVVDNVVGLQQCTEPPQQSPVAAAASAQPCAQSAVVSEAVCAVTERLAWATDELRRASSIETCCQLCQLIRSCADAVHALQHVSCSGRDCLH